MTGGLLGRQPPPKWARISLLQQPFLAAGGRAPCIIGSMAVHIVPPRVGCRKTVAVASYHHLATRGGSPCP